MKKTVLVALADGFEEIEAVTPIDVLRRAGVEVTVAGVGKDVVTGANGVKIQADLRLEDYGGLPDAVVLPGGAMGAANLRDSQAVSGLLKRMKENGRLIAAICASPGVVLARQGYLDGKSATCYPGYEKNFPSSARYSAERVVGDGHLVTSRGPGTALEFSLELVRRLVDAPTADKILQATLAKA
ncbi:MAG TPA: DJ-1 family glyoxalase III [Candidatus Eisenbacteria bacterium]|nr:DJ-1 family glyoxalase III [Candidatus Eisenbacteria bacterium]